MPRKLVHHNLSVFLGSVERGIAGVTFTKSKKTTHGPTRLDGSQMTFRKNFFLVDISRHRKGKQYKHKRNKELWKKLKPTIFKERCSCLYIFLCSLDLRSSYSTVFFTIYEYMTNSQPELLPEYLIAQLVEHCIVKKRYRTGYEF